MLFALMKWDRCFARERQRYW